MDKIIFYVTMVAVVAVVSADLYSRNNEEMPKCDEKAWSSQYDMNTKQLTCFYEKETNRYGKAPLQKKYM